MWRITWVLMLGCSKNRNYKLLQYWQANRRRCQTTATTARHVQSLLEDGKVFHGGFSLCYLTSLKYRGEGNEKRLVQTTESPWSHTAMQKWSIDWVCPRRWCWKLFALPALLPRTLNYSSGKQRDWYFLRAFYIMPVALWSNGGSSFIVLMLHKPLSIYGVIGWGEWLCIQSVWLRH